MRPPRGPAARRQPLVAGRPVCDPAGVSARPTTLFVFGPPAVGKMTVGRAVAQLTGWRLVHNHMTIEPVLDVFPFGSPSFERIVDGLRRQILHEATAAPEVPGLVFTFAWGLELEADLRLVADYVAIVEDAGGRLAFLELAAPLDVRLARNRQPDRLEAKRSKRDVAFSDGNLRSLERHVLNTGTGQPVADGVEALLGAHPYLRVDNADRPPEEVAALAVATLGLPLPTAPSVAERPPTAPGAGQPGSGRLGR